MGTRLSSSTLYAHLWGTPELDAVFDERAMLQTWLDELAALARAQASLSIVPAAAAAAIGRAARVEALDLDYVAEQTRATAHSTLGLIRGLLQVLPADVREYVYLGATVQDVSDTWFGLVMSRVGAIVWRDLRGLEALLLDLAAEHRNTVMAGRTHGQPGAPITFGFKVASWADEVRRHVERLRDGRERWCVGQLGGAVGALAFFGADGPEQRARFCAELGLADPGISWLTARDRVAEFGGVLAMVCGTLARIGTEVYELARPEIGELAEPAPPGAVSSITMPHKRNPEAAEHLDTLARLARAAAGVLVEGMVAAHERDGRAWKAEWLALPEICQLTGAALRLALGLVRGLEVHPEAMARNVSADLGSERVLAGLSARIGKHQAQQALHEVLREDGADLVGGLADRGLATAEEVRGWATADAVAAAGAMVDTVLARAAAARAAEPERWRPMTPSRVPDDPDSGAR
jgi:adenylosuccinate lyase